MYKIDEHNFVEGKDEMQNQGRGDKPDAREGGEPEITGGMSGTMPQISDFIRSNACRVIERKNPYAIEGLEMIDGKSILMIDDESFLINLAKIRLEATGARVQSFESVSATKEALADMQNRLKADIILLDNKLGRNSFGHELLEDLKKAFPGAVIIVHTSDPDALVSDKNNPYTTFGVHGFSKKLDYKGIGEILKRAMA